jgi:hypothetical protein
MENLPLAFTVSTRVSPEPKRVYDLNIPLAECKNDIPAQTILRTYDSYALQANKRLRFC